MQGLSARFSLQPVAGGGGFVVSRPSCMLRTRLAWGRRQGCEGVIVPCVDDGTCFSTFGWDCTRGVWRGWMR
jgi:hypothetical protein